MQGPALASALGAAIRVDTPLGEGLYGIVVEQAKQLIEPDDTILDNPEYIRGMCELVASVFSIRGMYTVERAKQVARNLGITQDIYQSCDAVHAHALVRPSRYVNDVPGGGRA